jgi:hypothetical protein
MHASVDFVGVTPNNSTLGAPAAAERLLTSPPGAVTFAGGTARRGINRLLRYAAR